MGTSKALSARKEPSQERSRQTVAAILDAATQVFSSEGYASATTARIAARAGVSVGSLYQYFPNKHSLLAALGQQHVRQSHELIARALDDDTLDGLSLEGTVRHLATALLELHLRDSSLHRLLFEEVPRQAPVIEAKHASDLALLKRFVRILSRHREVRVRDLRVAAAFVGQVVEALTHWYVLEAPQLSVDRDGFIDEVQALVCGYLTGASAQRRRRR